jgi:hypothetical protein
MPQFRRWNQQALRWFDPGPIAQFLLITSFIPKINWSRILPDSWNSNGKFSGLFQQKKIACIIFEGVFWDVTPCGSCKNRRFGGT